VNTLGMSPWACGAAGPTGCYRLMEGEEPLQPRGQSRGNCLTPQLKGHKVEFTALNDHSISVESWALTKNYTGAKVLS